MLSSLARYLEPLPGEEGDPFLTQIQADFMARQQPSDQEEEEQSPRASDSEDFAFDQLIGEEKPPEGGGGRGSDPDSGGASDGSEANGAAVLHLGSVLSSDYLL